MKNTKERLVIQFERDYDESKTKKNTSCQWNEGYQIEYPMYRRHYEDALAAVLNSIESNSLQWAENQGAHGCGGGKYGVPLQKSNIIAFTGSRGAGKTTAITEFGRILESYYPAESERGQGYGYGNGSRKGCRFHVLPLIDASVLSAKEDLIEVILASMYQIVNTKQRGCKQGYSEGEDKLFTRIIAEFDNVYKDYLNVGNHGEQNTSGGSVLVKLRNVSDSLKIKVALEKLTESFLEILEGGRRNEDSYLVVMVDDLDMNPRNGFEMLEQLYKYLSNPRIVILIAIKYEQMFLLSEKNFVDGLVPKYGSTHERVYNKYEKVAKTLADEYLLKALPIENRIYLPERSKLYQEAWVAQGETNLLPVKDFLLKKTAQKMDIYYDAKGLKKHFILPCTVRELVSYNAFLDSLLPIEEMEKQQERSQEGVMELYDQNHERFNRDIEGRMALKLLNDEQLAVYRSIMERHVERRGGYMLCFIRSWMRNKGYFRNYLHLSDKQLLRAFASINDKGNDRKRLEDSVDELDYCYTDLMQVLYDLGRKDYEDKVLVHCIMASFTSEMAREYYSYRYGSEEARKSAGKNLRSFLGTTFGGDWLAEVMPKVALEMGRYSASLDACYKGNVSVLDLVIESASVDLNWEKTEEWLTDLLAENLPYLECISLLFANAKDEAGRRISPEWTFDVRKRDRTEDGVKAVLIITGRVGKADFDMFGFLGREMKEETSFQKRDESLMKALELCALRYCNIYRETATRERIRSLLRMKATKKSIWHDRQENMAFPYYDFDMAYNVVKRVRRKMAGTSSVSSEQICEYYRTVYGYMAHCLWEEEKYYKDLFESDNADNVPEFYNSFMNSPFIKAFGAQYEGQELWPEKPQHKGLIKKSGSGERLDTEKLNKFLLGAIKSLDVNVVKMEDEEEPE